MSDYIATIIERYEADLKKVQQDGYALHYVKEQTYELCLAAVQQDGRALQYVKDPLIREKLRLELKLYA